ncbi:MAG: protein-glutamate O-methyltransferase CheR [Acidobacteria bacterium]|nr:protein-glutamate O-methyltransferase CheR [Acidobacteriota bacterium]
MPLSTSDFDYIRTFVAGRSGIVLETGKEYLVEARLQPLATRLRLAGIPELVAAMRRTRDRDLERQVIESMTTHETTFFRDVAPWEALQKHVLPRLIQARRVTRQLKLWCAAASTGQEPYSIAMLLADQFPELDTWQVQFIASDLSLEVLERARAGRYSQLEVNRGLPAHYLVKYFTRHGATWEIRPEIRKRVDFQQINLIEPWPVLPAFDIVFIRNVMIYFDTDAKRSILGRIRQRLRADGHLFLGAAETTLNIDAGFARTEYERAGCYRIAA